MDHAVNRTLNLTPSHLRMITAVLVIAVMAGLTYEIVRTPADYLESATVMISLPKAQTSPNAYDWYAPSLITSSEAMTRIMMGSQVQQRIRAAGGTASISLALVNLYNEEYPNYGVPLATLAAASPSPANVHRTFVIAARLLDGLLATRQAQAGVPPSEHLAVQVMGDTGPQAEAGSPKRVLAGLALLTVIVISVLWGFLARWTAGRTSRALVSP
jgi:hypothetical protein